MSLVLSTLQIVSEYWVREVKWSWVDWSSIRSILITELLRGIFIITLEFWHQIPFAFLLKLLPTHIKTLAWTMSVGVLLSHGAVFLVINLWTSVIKSRCCYTFLCNFEGFFLFTECWFVLYTPIESGSICSELFILILDCIKSDLKTVSLPGQLNISLSSGTRHWILS